MHEGTKALLIGALENWIAYLPTTQFNGSNIRFVRRAKNFGVTLNRELNWSNHVRMSCGRTFTILQNLCMSQYFTPKIFECY